MSESVFILHPVPLIPQPTDQSCWAAAVSMVLGNQSVGPGKAATFGDGLILTYENVQTFARSHGLSVDRNVCLRIADLRKRLRKAPVMLIGEDERQGHAVVLAGMWGDGSAQGTTLLILDPSPPKVGARKQMTYARFSRAYRLVAVYFLYR